MALLHVAGAVHMLQQQNSQQLTKPEQQNNRLLKTYSD